ncbi:alpha/beta hydrolase [Micromonospora sp. ATA32]|nr:alpha/beta hydrolase [Micromonospora sp. ATA32]
MPKPTVVLVHGAFADAASFARVVPPLLDAGVPVRVPAVPNRSLITDAAYIASVVRQIDGPVVLVGHSYGGAVVTVAGTESNVQALVYLSAYVPDEGENLFDLQGHFPATPLAQALVQTSYPMPGSSEQGTDISVNVDHFPAIFAADVEPGLARVLAVSQRPLAMAAFTDKAPAAAWKSKPSWGTVATADQTLNPDLERFGYQRAGTNAIEIGSSHLVMLSHPAEVVSVIHQAMESVPA